MAQKIFTPFKSEITSFELREAYAGIFHPGVYRGYDRAIPGGSANVYEIEHTSVSGYQKTQINNTAEANLSGMLVMPNGLVVHDNLPVEITLSALGGSTTRTDAILGSIHFLDTAPGATFTYLVEEGVNPNTFTPSNPQKEVVIGFITVDSEGHTYIRAETPNLAKKPDLALPNFNQFARRVETNTFLGINRFANHVALKSLVQSYLWVKNQIDGDGYILINGDTHYQDGNEFIFDLQGATDIGIWGFKYAGWDFGGNSDIHLVNGTTIRVRFVNVGAGCKFKQYTDQKGFWIPNDTTIQEHVLYTMRMEQNASATLSGFTVSPLVNPGDLVKVNETLVAYNNQLLQHIQDVHQLEVLNITPLLASGWVIKTATPNYIIKDYFNNVTVRLNLRQAVPAAFTGWLIELDEEWLPPDYYRQSAFVQLTTGGNDLARHIAVRNPGASGNGFWYSADTAPFTAEIKLSFTYKAYSF